MVRTQIYLTTNQKSGLDTFMHTLHKSQSELIRKAIDEFIERHGFNQRKHILQKTAGIWHDRNDLPDFQKLRKEWDRI